jgi:regulator of replication initiation timing
MKQHPLSAAFPAMSAEDFQALKDDIEVNGQREPVIVLDGMVLDGWHRYRACSDLGLNVKHFTFGADDDAAAFVLSHNLHRRHLTASQRAAAVVACSQWTPPSRPQKGAAAASFSTNAGMAKAAHVSERTIKDAKAAHRAGLGDVVKAGAMTAEEAASVARGGPQSAAKRYLQQKPADVPELTQADELAEARDVIASLSEDNDRLRDRLAVESMDASEEAKTDAAETIAELRQRVTTLEAELEAVKASRDGYMRENAQLKKQCDIWRKQAENVKGMQ